MSRSAVTVAGRSYLIARDDPVIGGLRRRPIVLGRAVDELTDTPVEPVEGATPSPRGQALESRAARSRLSVRQGPGGLVALLGVPRQVLPRLDAAAYDVGMEIRAVGYLPRTISRPLGPIPAFPNDFSPANFGDVPLHRAPVELFGRVMRRVAGAWTAVPGAQVRLTGLWRIPPAIPTAADPPNIVALWPAIYGEWKTADGAQVRRVTLAPTLGQDKRLLSDAPAGSRQLRLSDRVGLGVTTALAVDALDPSQVEHLRITGVSGSASAADPATVTLAFPLARGHRARAVARKVTPQGLGPARPLAADALPGDGCVLTGTVAGLGVAADVQLDAGGPRREFHRLQPFDVVSDAAGYYRLPPLSRVAQIELEGRLGPAQKKRIVGIAYGGREQQIDLLLS